MTLLGLILLLYASSQIILLGSFARLEQQDTQRNIERARDALLDDITVLDRIVGDWAPWDDTYDFIQTGNEEYIELNLNATTLANLKVNYMLFYNTSGYRIYGTGVDIKSKDNIPVPELFQHDLSPDDILIKHSNTESRTSGIIILPEGPMLISSHPIITSERNGPIQGTLIMGRFLDSNKIEDLSRITHLSLNFSLFDAPKTADFGSAITSLSKEEPISIQPISENIIAGYVLLNDLEGNPALVLKAEMPRGIHIQGESTMRYLVLSIFGSGLIFGLVMLMLLEKSVLSRLAFLSSNVNAIGVSGSHSMRISMTGKDELSDLAEVINKMLEELEQAEEAKKRELLFKEIYHRVKNNLQIIISLLNLQSQKTQDKEMIRILKDNQDRIRAMALIHERLYKSRDLAGINFKEYIHDLVNNLFLSYGVNAGVISMKIDIGDIIMNLDTASPCGLIVTELVSNSLKHAFPSSRKGELLIKLDSYDNNKKFVLTVSDNGIGLPEDIDIQTTKTLGMQLVTSLVRQLKGRIEVDRTRGTEVKITFEEKRTGVFE